MRDTIEAVCLGVLQGLTEFLPISSSGHLQALKTLSQSDQLGSKSLDIFLHFATLLAVFVVFRREFVRLLKGVFQPGENRRWLGLVILGAVPGGIVGLVLHKFHVLEALSEDFPYLVPLGWLATAALLWSLRNKETGEPPRPLDFKAALAIGCAQALAVLPGISRSGFTIGTAIRLGCGRQESAAFSFLCATPLILGATALEIMDLWQAGNTGLDARTSRIYWIGGGIAFVTGLAALWGVLRMLEGGLLHRWAYYLVPAAAVYAGCLAWMSSS